MIKYATNGQEFGEYRVIPDTHTECAPQPSPNHVLADNWASSPMNPAVCWRNKTQQEIEEEGEQEAEEVFEQLKLAKALAIWVAGHLNIPLSQAKAEIKAIYKGLP